MFSRFEYKGFGEVEVRDVIGGVRESVGRFVGEIVLFTKDRCGGRESGYLVGDVGMRVWVVLVDREG